MSNRWVPAVVVFGLFAATAAADKDRPWSAAFAVTSGDSGRLAGSCSTGAEASPAIDARLTLWDEHGRMVTVPVVLRVLKVKAATGQFVFDAAFNPAEHLPGGALLGAHLVLSSGDCRDLSGSILIENVSSAARHSVAVVPHRRD